MRHGETVGEPGYYGSTDIPLSDHGWSQMKSTIELIDLNWDIIISSPLRRCVNFAKSLVHQQTQLEIRKELQEIHFGAWDGKTTQQIMKEDAALIQQYWSNPEKVMPPDGENMIDFERRIVAVWQQIVKQYQAHKILMIIHGGTIRIILKHVLNLPVSSLFKIEVPHGCLSVVRINYFQGKLNISLASHGCSLI